MTGLHLHLDLPAGIAGDMTLGALLDLGVPEAVVRAALEALPIEGWELRAEKCLRRGMAGTDVTVRVHGASESEHADRKFARGAFGPEHAHAEHAHAHAEHDHAEHDHPHAHGHDDHHHADDGHPHRHYADILAMLDAAPLAPAVRTIARKIFDRVARAEARLHGAPSLAEVAFHEVGAIDSIIDIVGTAAAFAWLAPASVSCSPVPLGHGTTRTAHGLLPVPAPAALEILRDAGIPVLDGGVAKELTTPTGAAIVAALATSFGAMPPVRVRAIGYGAGDRDLADRPNLVRAVLGEPIARAADGEEGPTDMIELAANLDDLAPELAAHAAERLFAAGCVNVWFVPITMKKGRPAVLLGALVRRERLTVVVDTLLAETSAIGVRWHAVERKVLDRRHEVVDTPFGPLPIKVASDGARTLNAAPEYEACRAAALAFGAPLKDVYAAAIAAYRQKASPADAPKALPGGGPGPLVE